MSRIAKYPVELPKGVEVTMSTGEISVKGPLGTLKQVALRVLSRSCSKTASTPCRLESKLT